MEMPRPLVANDNLTVEAREWAEAERAILRVIKALAELDEAQDYARVLLRTQPSVRRAKRPGPSLHVGSPPAAPFSKRPALSSGGASTTEARD
jgi:hypothetical protein